MNRYGQLITIHLIYTKCTLQSKLHANKTNFSLAFLLSARTTLTLSSLLPMKTTVRMVGHQRSNSFFQLLTVDFGTMTMCGPGMFLKCFR